MTATNHALTGALIGLTVGNPIIAVPLAITSHFVLDTIPHFGFKNRNDVGNSMFLTMLICEAAACFSIVLLLGLTHPLHWVVGAVSAFAAASPDFMWIPMFLRARAKKKRLKLQGILLFHHVIQWFQQPIGVVVEAAWLVSFGYLFLTRL